MRDPIRTARLVLRRWRPEDAPQLKEAIDSSLAELQLWVPWAMQEPSPVDVLVRRLAGMRDRFLAADDWAFGVLDATGTRVLGGAGLHRRGGTDHLEIGYWIRTDATGQGLATEAAEALCAAAFEHPGIVRVEIRCDAQNGRSAAVPRRLGFTLAGTAHETAITRGGATRNTLIWSRGRDEGADRAAPVGE